MASPADVIVVGSGPTGIHAAAELLDRGFSVQMLDIGRTDEKYLGAVPNVPYAELRRTSKRQFHFILGEHFEGIDLGPTGPLAQSTPPRAYAFQIDPTLMREATNGFAAIQSHAAGGLGEAWGAGAFAFTDEELRQAGFVASEFIAHYKKVAEEIGISGDNDDVGSWCGSTSPTQPAFPADANARAILESYASRRAWFQQQGLRIGRPRLALLTCALGARSPNPGTGLDFYSNFGNNVFRPSAMIGALRLNSRFTYTSGVFITRFEESDSNSVAVHGVDCGDRCKVTFNTSTIILAAGAFGTARIVLRSMNQFDQAVPLVCNEHAFIPTLRWRGIGSKHMDYAHALAQLTLMFDQTGDQKHLVQAQAYSYTGLLLNRLLKESPLGLRDSIAMFRTLAPALVTLGVQHEDHPHARNFCLLRKGPTDLEDCLEISWSQAPNDARKIDASRRKMAKFMRKLGCIPLGVVHPPAGSSVHYGGMFPTSTTPRPLTTDPQGRLHGARSVYIADGSSFQYLPAKGPTYTLMANARRVAASVAKRRISVSR